MSAEGAQDPSGRLGARERALLDFERDWASHQGMKEDAIRRAFGISAARYYQLLARLVDREEARDYDPLLVTRLRRRRRQRRQTGIGRSLRQQP